MFGVESIVHNSEDEEFTENELKKHKARETELDEHQRIVREAKEKEKVEKDAQVALEGRKLLFPKWTLKRIQREAVELPSQNWLEPVVSFRI